MFVSRLKKLQTYKTNVRCNLKPLAFPQIEIFHQFLLHAIMWFHKAKVVLTRAGRLRETSVHKESFDCINNNNNNNKNNNNYNVNDV